MKPANLLIAASAALLGIAVIGCENNTAPASGRMTTDADHGLEVNSQSPSTPRTLGIRAGSTVPPANAQPEVTPNTEVAPMPPGMRTTPSDRPYTGNPTTKPSPGVSASPANPPRNPPINTTRQP